MKELHYIDAWQSIENHVRDITANKHASTEIEYLLKELNRSCTSNLF